MKQKTINANIEKQKTITKSNLAFGFNYVKVTGEKNYTLNFNKHLNLLYLSDKQNNNHSAIEGLNIMKFCLTGKSDYVGHLKDKGVNIIETSFYNYSDEYIIRIFLEHQYKGFLIKVSKNENFNKEEVLIKCNSLREIQNKICPYIKNILNLPNNISLPQFFRFFFLNDSKALHRIVSEKEYNMMTTLLMEYIISKSKELYNLNPKEFSNLAFENDSRLIFITYSINFIEDKIERLNKQQEIEIQSIKKMYKNEVKLKLNSEINKTLSNIRNHKEIYTQLKRKLNNYKKTLNNNFNDHKNNQFLLFKEKINTKSETKLRKEKISLLEIEISHINVKLNYLESTLRDLKEEKAKLSKKYSDKIMNVIAEFQEKILQERINLESLLEEKKEIVSNNINQIDSEKNHLTKIIDFIEYIISKYLIFSKLKYTIKLTNKFQPYFIINDKNIKDIETINLDRRILISLSFYLGLMEFSINYNKAIPPIFILNLTKLSEEKIQEINKIIYLFKKRIKNNSIQFIILLP